MSFPFSAQSGQTIYYLRDFSVQADKDEASDCSGDEKDDVREFEEEEETEGDGGYGKLQGSAVWREQLPFWLVLSLEDRSVKVRFHTVGVTRDQVKRVCQKIRDTVADACFRVNQLCLLMNLNETRTCSDLLIMPPVPPKAPRSASMGSSMGSGQALSSGDTLVGQPEVQWAPGHFACTKRVLSLAIPLHKRMNPKIALRDIAPKALRHFIVHNRPNLYVFQVGPLSTTFC
jgi:hypothetical protein